MGATHRKRGKRSWQVRVFNANQEATVTVRSEQDARDLVREVYRRELAGINVVDTIREARSVHEAAPPAPAWPSLREAYAPFHADMVQRGAWSGSTPLTYQRRLDRHVLPFSLNDGRVLGDLPLNQITEPMLGEVLDAVRRNHRSVATQDQIRSPLRALFRWWIKRRSLPGPNPAADLAEYMGKAPTKRARAARLTYFTAEEVGTLFETCAKLRPQWTAFVGCGVFAGLRFGEIAGLEWRDVDFAEGTLHVQRAVVDKTREVKAPKDGEGRYVPLTPTLAAWLRDHRETMVLEADLKGWPAETRTRVFSNTAGHPVRYPAFLEHGWRPLLREAQLRYRKFHSTRHSFASLLLHGDQPANLLDVQAWLGHSTLSQTEGYLHRARASKAARGRAVAALDRLVS